MRSAGIGLLLVGLLIAIVGSVGAGDQAGALLAHNAGGFLFVAGAVFAAGAEIRDAINRR